MYRINWEENRSIRTFAPGIINLKFSGSLSKHVKWEIQVGMRETNFNKFLKDYYIELVDPISGIEGFGVRLGQLKYLWSIEREESSSERKTVYRSQVVSALVADRDRGIEILYTGFKNLRIALGIWNGEIIYKNPGTIYETIDYTRNLDDSDVKKDITLYAGYDFKFSEGDRVSLNGAFLAGSNGRMNISDKKRYGFGLNAFFINENLHFRGEFIGGNDNEVKKHGYYVQLSYRFFDYLEPVVKYEMWDNDVNVVGKSKWLSFGIYSRFLEHLIFRFNYIKKSENPIDVKNDELILMIQVNF